MKLLFHTVKYLKPVQVFGRIWFRLYRPPVNQALRLTRRTVTGPWLTPCKKVASFLGTSEFRFLNHTRSCVFPGDWNNPEWDKLWLYNLHYFDDLQAAGADRKQAQHAGLIDAWIKGNPPGQGNGWEPYPTSLRIVNWIKWILAGNMPSSNILESLAIQAGCLRKRLEIHLLGNHLFANAKALVFAGLFFRGREADEWLKKGLKILGREVSEQILPDGGHFERSPMYHAIILEDLLDLVNVMRAFGHQVPHGWEEKVGEMISWLCGMCHPDGDIALFNDAAFGIAAVPEALVAYAGRLGLGRGTGWVIGTGFGIQTETGMEGAALERPNSSLFKQFTDTGYIRWEKGPAIAFLDVGPVGPDYLPGHAHADTLSFELSLFGQRVVVDTGTSCYGTGHERHRQRGTAAHNTVTINNENSSEVWGGFRVARRARPLNLDIAGAEKGALKEGLPRTVACSHTGYCRLPGRPVHRRCWTLTETFFEITDEIQGPFENAVARFHFHPDVEILGTSSTNTLQLCLCNGQKISITLKNSKFNITESTWHPEFGVTRPNKCLEAPFHQNTLTTTINWGSDPVNLLIL